MTETIKNYVDNELIDRVNKRIAAAQEAFDKDYAQLSAVRSARGQAKKAAEDDPSMHNEEALELAERAVRVAERIFAARPGPSLDRLRDWSPLARAAAWGPVILEGLRRQVAAAAKLDAARALLHEAKRDFVAAVAFQEAAHAAGHPQMGLEIQSMQLPIAYDFSLQTFLNEGERCSAEELLSRRIRGNRVDVEAATTGWANHILSQEPK